MSALQKIERGYDLLIRLMTVIITLALLVGAGVLGVNWLRVTATAPADQTVETPKVSASDLVTHVLSPEISSNISSNDPDHASYERISVAVAEFAKKHHVADDDVNMGEVVSGVKSVADDESTEALTHAYVSGMADTFEHTLTDPKIDTLLAKLAANAQSDSSDDSTSSEISKPMDVVSSVQTGFSTEFDRQVAQSTEGTKGVKDVEKERKGSLTTLAQIGLPLGLLVLLLQLLTFGKIAQSLGTRHRGLRRQV